MKYFALLLLIVAFGALAAGATAHELIRFSHDATIKVCASNAVDTFNCDALADGVADQVEINAALASASGPGRRVVLSEGLFHLSGPVTVLNSDVALDATPGTTLFLVNGASATMLQIGNGINPISTIIIRGGTWDGNRMNQAGMPDGMLIMPLATKVLIENVQVKNVFGVGVNMWQSSTLRNSLVEGNGENIVANYGYATIESVVSRNSGPDETLDLAGDFNRVVNSEFYGSADIGGWQSGVDDSSRGHYLVLIGNRFYDNPNEHGFQLRNTDYSTISNNIFWNNGMATGSSQLKIQNSDYNTIIGNILGSDIGAQGYLSRTGIELDSQSDFNTIVGNQAHANRVYQIIDQGQGNVIMANQPSYGR